MLDRGQAPCGGSTAASSSRMDGMEASCSDSDDDVGFGAPDIDVHGHDMGGSGRPLFLRLGGMPALQAAVDVLQRKLMADPEVWGGTACCRRGLAREQVARTTATPRPGTHCLGAAAPVFPASPLPVPQ
jgi:hypothetical protein